MSDSMMKTDPGGENTQYESINTVNKPISKDGGTMGEPETKQVDSNKTSEEQQERGEKTADNIRYGQNMSESGMGGKTEGMTGSASGGGMGETAAETGDEQSAEETREEQGYGKGQDMDNEIGA